MAQVKTEQNNFSSACIVAIFLCLVFFAGALLIYNLLPSETIQVAEAAPAEIAEIPDDSETTEDYISDFQDYFAEISLTQISDDYDKGLTLYRQPLSRSAVEWFYYQICGNRNVTQAILSEAEKNDIPLSLAFALAHTESNYNSDAVNNNKNATVDRGLFQLNSNSFPALSEADFFDPYISAKYGMSHLKFCLNTAGNQVSALAMYNAGTGAVRSNKTPQTTLNYVGKIMSYQKLLDTLFTEQVVAYYEPQIATGIAVAYTK
ncbi:MAG: lytic transglycosylase domain-containing protein [Treponema sp.]|nr:lytic transglycosylase domain-containing protein [Treponema sp.]